MNLGNFIIPKYFQRTDSFGLMNNIFTTLFVIVIYLSIIEYLGKSIKEKNTLGIVKGIGLLILPIAIGFIIIMNIAAPGMMYAVFIIPTPLFVEGGPVFILLGIMMYLFREKKENACYSIFNYKYYYYGNGWRYYYTRTSIQKLSMDDDICSALILFIQWPKGQRC